MALGAGTAPSSPPRHAAAVARGVSIIALFGGLSPNHELPSPDPIQHPRIDQLPHADEPHDTQPRLWIAHFSAFALVLTESSPTEPASTDPLV